MSLNTLLSPNELNLYSESVTTDRLNITRDINITGADGDILYIEGNELKKLSIGANGKVLKVSASLPSWQTDDTTETASELKTTGSNVVIGTSAPPTAGQVLKANSPTTASWQDDSGGGSLQDAYNLGATINLDDINNNISIDATNYTGDDGALYIVNTANNAFVKADLTNNANIIATKNNLYQDPDNNTRAINTKFTGSDVEVSHISSGGNYTYKRVGGISGTFTFENQTGDVNIGGSNILIQPSSGTVNITGTTTIGQNIGGDATFQVDTVNNKISELETTITFTDTIDNTVQTDFPSIVGTTPQPYQWFLLIISGGPAVLTVKSDATLSYTSASTFLTDINTFFTNELIPYAGASVIFDYNSTTKLFSFTINRSTHDVIAVGMTKNLGDSININTTDSFGVVGSTSYLWVSQPPIGTIMSVTGNSPWRNESVLNQYDREYISGDLVLSTPQTAIEIKPDLWGTSIKMDNNITLSNGAVVVENDLVSGFSVSGTTTGVDNLVVDTANSKITMEADETLFKTSKAFTKTFLSLTDDGADGMKLRFVNQDTGGVSTIETSSVGNLSISTPGNLDLQPTNQIVLNAFNGIKFITSTSNLDWPTSSPVSGSTLVYDGTPLLKWIKADMQTVYTASTPNEISMNDTGLVLKNLNVPLSVVELFRIDTSTHTAFRVARGVGTSTVEIKGGSTPDKFTVKNATNQTIFQVDTVNNNASIKSPTANASAFYVEEPTFTKVFNVSTLGGGTTTIQGNAIMDALTSVRGANNNNKFYVENATATNKIINVKTNTEGSAPGTVTFDANIYNPSNGYNIIRGDNYQAFSVETSTGTTVMNIDTISNGGEVAIRRLYPVSGSAISAGSMYYAHTDTDNTLRNLPIGATNDVLRVQAGIPTWVSPLKQNFQYFTNILSGTLPSASTTCTLAWATPNYTAYPINYTGFTWSGSSFKSADWTLNANNSLTYTNATTKRFRINYSLCIMPDTNDRDFRAGVCKVTATYPTGVNMSSATNFIQQSLTCFTLKDGTPNQGSVDNSFYANIAQNDTLQIVVGCVQAGEIFSISGITLTVEEVKDLA